MSILTLRISTRLHSLSDKDNEFYFLQEAYFIKSEAFSLVHMREIL